MATAEFSKFAGILSLALSQHNKKVVDPLQIYPVLFSNIPPAATAAAAAAAKSLQSCPTLCDPINGSPPGSTVPGILQARTLEWVAISFSNA